MVRSDTSPRRCGESSFNSRAVRRGIVNISFLINLSVRVEVSQDFLTPIGLLYFRLAGEIWTLFVRKTQFSMSVLCDLLSLPEGHFHPARREYGSFSIRERFSRHFFMHSKKTTYSQSNCSKEFTMLQDMDH